MTEKLKIFDENKNEIGIADRVEVHKKGYWHETFQCWIEEISDGIDYIYFQIRSDNKKDFPNLLDITAAGHLLANENVNDGIREVEEELGIIVSIEELRSLGVIEDCILTTNFFDREFANVFLYKLKETDSFILQKEEVSGIVKAKFIDFYDLCMGKEKEMRIEGFDIDDHGEHITISRNTSLEEFVPHQKVYLEKVARLIADNIK